MHEGVCNHLSVKAPSAIQSHGDVIITAPYGVYWTEITPELLVGKLSVKEIVDNKLVVFLPAGKNAKK